MKRTMLLVGLMAGASWMAGAQQSNGNDPYQGVSTPPPDQEITTAQAATPKPHAGKAMRAESDPDAGANGADAVLQPEAERNVRETPAQTNIKDPDGDIVHPVVKQTVVRQPTLSTRPAAPVNDPDGDMVQVNPLRPQELEAGTEIRVRLMERLSTATTQRGEIFHARVVTDVKRGDLMLIPAESILEGEVVEVSSGTFGGRGNMRLRPDYVTLPNGQRYHLSALLSSTPGSRTYVGGEGQLLPGSRARRDTVEYGGAVGAGVTTGAIAGGPVGALAGGLIGAGAITVHLLSDHPQAVLEADSVAIFTLSERLDLDIAPPQAN